MPTVTSVTKHFPSAKEGFTTTLNGGILSAAATVPLNSVTGYTNGDTIVLVVDPTDATKKQVFTGIVDTSGVQLTSVVWTEGTNQAHTTGATVVDYVTATHMAIVTKGLKVQHAQDGTHTGITSTSLTNVGAFSQTGATTLAGSWDGWVGANESWAFASSTTITVPTDATTKYDIGDFVKITQSSTVKYFVITSLTATVLTVSGLAGVTVANSAISANAYSKSANPHGTGTLGGLLPYNPYKFSVYRNAAWTTSNGVLTAVPFDTKEYDTGTNVDVVTNKGRFTAPMAGYYFFSGRVQAINPPAGNILIASLGLNGAEYKRGT